ncbi:MAG: serine hydrolase [Dehalococcoidia bacterium]
MPSYLRRTCSAAVATTLLAASLVSAPLVVAELLAEADPTQVASASSPGTARPASTTAPPEGGASVADTEVAPSTASRPPAAAPAEPTGEPVAEPTVAAASASLVDAAPAIPTPLAVWGAAPAHAGQPPLPEVEALSAVILDEASGSILYQKAPHARVSPASLTKIMTALLALEHGGLDEVVEVTVDGTQMHGSTVMGLVPGERLMLRDLLYGLMLPSGNDAALAIAEHIGGSVPAFVEAMNDRSDELGLTDTSWANPHGLDADGHYTTAYDLALLTRAVMQREDFRTIADARTYRAEGVQRTYEMTTGNPLYARIEGVDGIKVGYTRRGRQTIVGSAARDGHRVYVVALVSPDRAADGVALFDWVFSTYRWPDAEVTTAANADARP